jgi:hypothetical protein
MNKKPIHVQFDIPVSSEEMPLVAKVYNDLQDTDLKGTSLSFFSSTPETWIASLAYADRNQMLLFCANLYAEIPQPDTAEEDPFEPQPDTRVLVGADAEAELNAAYDAAYEEEKAEFDRTDPMYREALAKLNEEEAAEPTNEAGETAEQEVQRKLNPGKKSIRIKPAVAKTSDSAVTIEEG